MADEKKLIYRLEAENTKLLRKLDASERKMKRFADSAKRNNQAISRSFSSLGSKVGAAVAAIASVQTVRTISRISDEYVLLRNRLKLVTDSEADLVKVEKALFKSAQDTRSEYAGTVELYARVARNADSLGLSQEKLLKLTTATNQAIQISGASTAEAAGGVIQFSQALAAGELRGDELRSVLENMPRLAQAIAEGLETDIGGLRKLSKEGLLTADRVTQALLNQASAIENEFGQLDRTVGQSITQLSNEFNRALSNADVSPLIEQIDKLKDQLSDPRTIQSLITLANAAIKAFGTILDFVTRATEAVQNFGESVAVAFGGIALDDLDRQRDEIKRLQDQLDNLRGGGEDPEAFGFVDSQISQIEAKLNAATERYELARSLFENTPNTGPSIEAPTIEEFKVDIPDPKGVKEMDKALKDLQKTLDSLKTPQEIFDENIEVAGQLLEANKITQFEYNQAIFAYTQELEKATGANQQWNKDLQDAANFAEQVITPLEALGDELRRIQDLFDKGLISPEVFERNVERIVKEVEEIQTPLNEMTEFSKQAARNMQDAFADFLFDPLAYGIDGLADSFARTLRRMAAEAAAAEIFKAIGSYGQNNEGILAGVATAFAGAFDSGGRIPGGKFGVVGERGPELVMGPANVVSRKETSEMMGGGLQIGTINLNGVSDEKTARKAAGQFARELGAVLSTSGRYS